MDRFSLEPTCGDFNPHEVALMCACVHVRLPCALGRASCVGLRLRPSRALGVSRGPPGPSFPFVFRPSVSSIGPSGPVFNGPRLGIMLRACASRRAPCPSWVFRLASNPLGLRALGVSLSGLQAHVLRAFGCKSRNMAPKKSYDTDTWLYGPTIERCRLGFLE